MKKLNLDINLVVDYYNHNSTASTAKYFNVCIPTLNKFLTNNNVKLHTRVENIKFTNLEKYGVENVFQSSEVINKIKQTKLEKYGDENYNNSSQIRETCIQKYGTPSASGSEAVKAKVKQTNLEKYGVENQFQRTEYLNDCIVSRYGDVQTFYDTQSNNRKQSVLEKYGVENVSQIESIKSKSLDSMRKTCMEKYGVEYNCLLPQAVFSAGNASNTAPNNNFAEILNSYGIDYTREFSISKYNYDFKINNILIEINPYSTHNSTWSPFGEKSIKSNTYHYDKSNFAIENGFRCIHVWDWDNIDKIINLLQTRNRIYARKCTINEVSIADTKEYLNKYHLQGYAKDSIRIGLFYENELVSIMTFGKPRYNKKYEYELIRYCSSYNVIGGAEKLFKHFKEIYNPKSIISYCDLSKFTGDTYTKLGFTLIHTTIGKHWYNPKLKMHITNNLLLQRGFDQLLGNIYGKYGKGTSNEELMLNHGFVEIYDAGQSTFIYNNTVALIRND